MKACKCKFKYFGNKTIQDSSQSVYVHSSGFRGDVQHCWSTYVDNENAEVFTAYLTVSISCRTVLLRNLLTEHPASRRTEP